MSQKVIFLVGFWGEYIGNIGFLLKIALKARKKFEEDVMKVIKMIILAVVSVLLVAVLSGCQTKNDKIKEFLYRYGNVTAEEIYVKSKVKTAGESANSFNYKIESLDVKSVNTKDIGGVTFHFVKCKMTYQLTSKIDLNRPKDNYTRFMALAIRENGFGDLLVDLTQSNEIIVGMSNDNNIRKMLTDDIQAGEELIR